MNGKILQTTLWGSDQLIVPKKQSNARGGKGLAVEPLGPGHISALKGRLRMSKNWTHNLLRNGREVLLKSRMRENLKSGSVRGLIVATGQNNPKRRWL